MNKEKDKFFVICHNVRSRENVGSIFRTADAFGVTKIYPHTFPNTLRSCRRDEGRFQILLAGSNTPREGVGIYLTGYTPAPPHPKISKTALGAESWVPWEKRISIAGLLAEFKKEGINIVALERAKRSISLPKFRPRFPLALILGNEVRGISAAILKQADKIVAIPMFGRKESLNVAVAFGIAAHHIRHNQR